MPTNIGIGFSSTSDPIEAFKAAAIEAKNQTNTAQSDMAVVFATAGYMNENGLETLLRILQPKRLIGAITPGIIINDRVETRGISVMSIASDELHFGSASLEKISLMPPREVGFNLAQSLLTDHGMPQRNVCIYFYDGLLRNGNQICAGVREEVGSALPILGAISTDSTKLALTQHFYQNRVLKDAAVGLLISGSHGVSIASRHSWKPLGKPRIVDGATGNLIKTIDKQPAVTLYEDYFRHTAKNIKDEQLESIRLMYPMGLGTSTPREYLIRLPIDIQEDGSILCQGDVPTGSAVHLMITDKDICRQSIHDAAVDIRTQMLGKKPRLILVFESMMRRKILGHAAVQGLRTIQDILGHNIPIFGMYTIGETVPSRSLKNIMEAQTLNGSFVLLAIG